LQGNFQTNPEYKYSTFNDFMAFCSNDPWILVNSTLISLLYLHWQKLEVIVFIVTCNNAEFIMSFVKLCYHDPRPYMQYYPTVTNYTHCNSEYGNPSGHCFMLSTYWLMILYFIDHNFYNFFDVVHYDPDEQNLIPA